MTRSRVFLVAMLMTQADAWIAADGGKRWITRRSRARHENVVRTQLPICRACYIFMSESVDEPTMEPPASSDATSTGPEGATRAVLKQDTGPTMPVSSTATKVKGLAAIFVSLFAIGFIINFSFSPASPLLNGPEPKVNEGLVKYGAVVTSAAGSD